ncbi:MAG: hypothetical protein JWM57_3837 [Phycisphaerales bacterium]|nr:hypothetical protein [Phycisphaerales bacterium]
MTAAVMPLAINCPHCDVSNPNGGAFCESCGMALPDPHYTGPRVVDAKSLPATVAGGELFGDQLLKQTKTAVTTLLVVGIVQIVIGGLAALAVMNLSHGRQANPAALIPFAVIGVIGLIFIGLSFWARHSPLPAAIVGLVLYSTLVVLNIATAMSNISAGGPQANNGLGGIGVGWLDIVIIIFLARGIQAALTHRRLLDSQQTA